MTAMISTVSITVLLTFIKCCPAANILVLGMPIYSHLAGPANVGKFLRSQGHNVLIAIPPQLKEKLEKHGVKLLLYSGLGDFHEYRSLKDLQFKKYLAERSLLHSLLFAEGKDSPMAAKRNISRKIFQDINLRKDIESFKPDLMIIDSTPLATIFTLIPYKMDIPFVMMGSTELAQFTRTSILPNAFPFKFLPYTNQMTFLQRLFNTLLQLFFYRHNPFVNWSLANEYAPEISVMDVPSKAKLWIIRQHSVLDYNRPLMPNVKRVGHLQIVTAPKPLPKELQSFLESADNGVIVVSFGSVLGSVPSELEYKLQAAFKQTKYKFVVQSSLQVQKNHSDQFMFLRWFPQFDLLRHPKTKLLITHCGSNSLQEALIAGVPIIGFPIFGDQPHNAGKVVRKGYGLKLELRSFSIQELVSAIEEVITNPSYKGRVEKASAILKSERVPPVEEAAYWINHVLTFGGEHLRSYAQDIPLWKYFGLDVIAFCLLIWHVLVHVIIILVKFCISRCFVKKQKLKDE